METKAHFVAVGAFILALAAAAVVGVFWLVRVNVEQDPDYYQINFPGSVSGLTVSSPVRFRGVPVGQVSDIRINPDDVERVQVIVAINVPFPKDMHLEASLELAGITGGRYVELVSDPEAPLMTPPGKGRLPEIPAKPSPLQQVVKSVPDLLNQAAEILAGVQEIIGEDNRRSIAATLQNIQVVTGALADNRQQIEFVLSDAGLLMTDLRATIVNLNDVLATAGRTGDAANREVEAIGAALQQTLGEVDVAVTEIGSAATTLNNLVKRSSRPIDDFISTGLYDLSLLIAEGRALVDRLNRVGRGVERNPRSLLFGDQNQGVQAQ